MRLEQKSSPAENSGASMHALDSSYDVLAVVLEGLKDVLQQNGFTLR